jgi:alpha-glucosidase
MRLILASLLLLSAAFAQDERHVTSPDGQIEFSIRIALPEPAALNQLAYQVRFHGKPLIDTSFLGLDILYQALLGAKLGLLSSQASKGDHYQSLIAEYMQDGSTGRLINVEVRVYNDGLAFRCVVPKSSPLENLRIEDEETEFRLAQNTDALSRIVPETPISLPFVAEQPGVAWIAITEARTPNYGRMSLIRVNGTTLISRLAKSGGTPNLAFDGTTPFTGPWRVILIGSSRSQVLESKLVNSLQVLSQ